MRRRGIGELPRLQPLSAFGHADVLSGYALAV